MNDQQVKHLEFLQAVILRMAGNSFVMKGWSVTLVAGLFALAAKDADKDYVAVALLPALCFWGLDAYYLWQERLFRALYDAVRTLQGVESFAMDTSSVAKSVKGWLRSLFARVVIYYHAPVVATIIIVWTVLRRN